MNLPQELRQRIYEEERFRLEARMRVHEEMRLRRQTAGFVLRVFVALILFATSLLVSEYYLRQPQPRPVASAPALQAGPVVSQAVLDDITGILRPDVEAEVCALTVARTRPQVRATIELARETSRDTARRTAVEKARIVGATLRKHGLAVPAYVEIFSPARWYGVATYDSDTLKVTWDPCPGRCEEEGTLHVRRCRG
ncbi:MAG: hypothetical protein QN187_14350 [Armatimonadota bacterium]|nr:hypothetical protein [Armatimonadota bacterium]MDR7520242.1 hypothetical protein [Armatimonadota bacterium]MDR7549422.1 hypothetical protein [Armatimonadota bacterium]